MANERAVSVRRELFIWKDSHEKALIQEVLAIEPYKFKSGTKEKGAAWTEIADNLSECGLRVNQRFVREKFEKIMRF